MANKVDISEVTDFSNDLQEASADFRSQLDKVKESIETINSMGSFSGKAAKGAKQYFGELHLTILDSFRGLFDDLEENLQQHLKLFGSNVDASESAIIQSNYLQDVKEDINYVFEDLEKQDEIIHDTIKEVSDISSSTPPSFSDVSQTKKDAVKKVKELDEDLISFNSVGDETDVKAIMHQIETVMSNAKTSEGKARFADFEGASQDSELSKLQDYNQDKKEEVMENAKDVKDSTIKDLNKTSSKNVVNKAYQEFKNGDITYDQYTAILDSVKKTSGNMNRIDLEEESTESFIKYLQDHEMLNQYVEDHKPFAHHVVDNVPGAARGSLKTFFEKLGYNRKEMADYLKNSDEIIKSVVNKTDSKFLREITKASSWSTSFFKTANYFKWGGWAFTGLGTYAGYQGDRDNGKTVGEALTHNLASLGGTVFGAGITFGAVALGASPIGWAAAAGIGIGIGLTATFDYFYDNNTFGIQDKLDKAGEKIDEFFQHPGESIKSGLDAINPFT